MNVLDLRKFPKFYQKRLFLRLIFKDNTIISVGKNIEYIEKHFTLDRDQEGFDHSYAMEPAEFAKYIQDIRIAEKANGGQAKQLSDQERFVAERARRGVYLGKNLNEGEIISFDDLLIVRPPSDFGADEIFKLIGKKIKNAKSKYAPLGFNDVELD